MDTTKWRGTLAAALISAAVIPLALQVAISRFGISAELLLGVSVGVLALAGLLAPRSRPYVTAWASAISMVIAAAVFLSYRPLVDLPWAGTETWLAIAYALTGLSWMTSVHVAKRFMPRVSTLILLAAVLYFFQSSALGWMLFAAAVVLALLAGLRWIDELAHQRAETMAVVATTVGYLWVWVQGNDSWMLVVVVTALLLVIALASGAAVQARPFGYLILGAGIMLLEMPSLALFTDWTLVWIVAASALVTLVWWLAQGRNQTAPTPVPVPASAV